MPRGSWSPLTVSITDVTGTTTSPAGVLTVINDGVYDVGAGSGDALVALAPVS